MFFLSLDWSSWFYVEIYHVNLICLCLHFVKFHPLLNLLYKTFHRGYFFNYYCYCFNMLSKMGFKPMFQVILYWVIDFFFNHSSFLDWILMVFRYTTDGGTRETLERGTISGDAVFSGKFQHQSLIFYTTFSKLWILIFLMIFFLCYRLFIYFSYQ